MEADSLLNAIVAGLATYSIVAIVVYVLLIVAQWKIFTKAGEAGWKSLIPCYNVYVMFKITWKTSMFWTYVGGVAVAAILAQFTDSSVATTIGEVVGCAANVLLLVDNFKLSKSFGHGIGYGIGLTLLPNVFTLILGFDGSKYVGAQD